ncbi:hypothetical protein Psta_0564 [Pirellula staleyi DSM 6068]|uniref:Uncharacterized protein n=1 Tax=Pirellula staleyi (strain ATCC 27377 / DSM 6068 / ICPB 4128) TaxID=530564 RepID=D2R4A3_PIRSD|nr:hypothetical protein Psta_0564 [Pirellula staleyi DSM 6068]
MPYSHVGVSWENLCPNMGPSMWKRIVCLGIKNKAAIHAALFVNFDTKESLSQYYDR